MTLCRDALLPPQAETRGGILTRANQSESAVYSNAFLTLGLVPIMSLPHYVFYALSRHLRAVQD